MQSSSLRLFQIAGITVYLHYSWFLVAIYQITGRPHRYFSPVFAVYEYAALFGIVLMHEFGHALACRQVGGFADRILLWPFGGIAFVRPPPRPGAELWSIAAGPLVNVALIPVLGLLLFFVGHSGMAASAPDFYRFIGTVFQINYWILLFNLLPIYPLDGGQILRSLLWFGVGRIKSLRIASVIGLIGSGLFILWALSARSIWIGLLAFFLMSQAIAGWRHAQALQAAEDEALRSPANDRPPIV